MSKDEMPKDIWDEAICDEQDDGCNIRTIEWIEFGAIKER